MTQSVHMSGLGRRVVLVLPAPRGQRGWAQRDLNPRPPVCKTGALPTELYARATREPIAAVSRGSVEGGECLLVLSRVASVWNLIHHHVSDDASLVDDEGSANRGTGVLIEDAVCA